jgi:AraC family transcriptional regulator
VRKIDQAWRAFGPLMSRGCQGDHCVSAATEERYLARFRKVFDYIDGHLDEPMSVETLSAIAAFSKFHFHRQFTGLFGISVYSYIQLCRLKWASYQLAFRDTQVVDVAMASGYEGPEGFARAFRKNFGQSPSEFRKQPQWAPWHGIYQPLSELRQKHMGNTYRTDQVRIDFFKDTRVAVLEHRGDPRRIGDSIRQFIAWRKQNQLPPRLSATFNILYDDPANTQPDDFRLDLCAAIEYEEVPPNEFGIVTKVIPGGRCAVLRHVGSDDNLGLALKFLYTGWLPQSGEELRDFPPYVQRLRFFPEVPEHTAVTDAFLPLK